MNCICVTGTFNSDLQQVFNILQHAGVQLAQSNFTNNAIDINAWHEHALNLITNQAFNSNDSLNLGRFMDQMASDIFLDNIKSPVWGWADTRSTELLDYWLAFEPRIHFVLVYTSPEQILASSMSTSTEPFLAELLMETWQRHNQQLLRFYYRNPQRCVLIDGIEAVKNPHAFVALCEKQWSINLLTPSQSNFFVESSSDTLALYLAKQICADYTDIVDLKHEILATLNRLEVANDTQANLAITNHESLIDSYRMLQDRSEEQSEIQAKQTAIDHLLQERDQLIQHVSDYDHQINDYQVQIEALNQTLNQQGDIESRLKEIEQENELLLLQLHQVQEELEHYFIQYQDKQNTLQLEVNRWQRMLAQHPEYCAYQAVQVSSDQNDPDNTLLWQLEQLDIGNRTIPQLHFKTFTEQGITGFIFTKINETETVFTRWPIQDLETHQLILMPQGEGEQLVNRIEALVSLSTSDWGILQALIRLVLIILNTTPQALNVPAKFHITEHINGLKALQDILDKFPAILRYDHVTLSRSVVISGYESLWITVTHLSFGDKQWSAFNFRLSCANVGSSNFGAHPKLEFPETSGPDVFESWFIESHDDFGGKLELRFALPDAMDIDVWQRFTDQDRAFLCALLMALPSLLNELEGTHSINRKWIYWHNMVKDMQHIVDQQVILNSLSQ